MMAAPVCSFLNRRQWAGLGALVLSAASLALLSTCELARTTRLDRPLEFFLLSPQRSGGTPLAYTDPTGAVTGFLAPEPELRIDRVQEIAFESRAMPVLSRGRVSGKRTRHFVRILLLRRDQRRLEAFTAPAVGSVMLVGLGGKILFTEYLTGPLGAPEFVLSGPDDPETLAAIRAIQASLPAGSAPHGDK